MSIRDWAEIHGNDVDLGLRKRIMHMATWNIQGPNIKQKEVFDELETFTAILVRVKKQREECRLSSIRH